MEFDVGQGFYQVIYNHLFGRNVEEFDPFQSYFITDVVMLNVDMLCL